MLSRLEGGSLDLPLLPQVAQEVMAETQNDEGDARRLADIVRHDPAMAGHVLRVANSPLFLPTSPIVSLQQAISRLGMAAIRRIALLITCQARVFRAAGHEAAVALLFRHSLAAAGFAQEIARLRRSNVEEAFLSGLLHDVGRPVVLQTVADLVTERQVPGPVDPAVAQTLAAELHERTGQELARHWGLMPTLVEAVGRHHHPHAASAHGQAVAMTAIADELAHLLIGTRETDEARCRDHHLWSDLNIYPDQVEAVLGRRPAVARLVEALT